MNALLVGIKEAAMELSVSADTVRRLAKRGLLRTVRVSRRVLVPATEIARIAQNGTGQKPASVLEDHRGDNERHSESQG